MKFWPALRYFIKFCLYSKTRQHIVVLAGLGLALSSASLLVLQSIMGGLQKKMIQTSKEVEGSAVIQFQEPTEAIPDFLSANQVDNETGKGVSHGVGESLRYWPEFELELLAKNGNYLAPLILHGVQWPETQIPEKFSRLDLTGIVLGADLTSKLRVNLWMDLVLVAPNIVLDYFGEVPAMTSEKISDLILTNLTEIDSVHGWSRISFVQNLVNQTGHNRIRLFGPVTEYEKPLRKWAADNKGKFLTWESQNPELMWAFGLETRVIVSLFMAMSFLVSVTIVAGNLVFYQKIRRDLVSFWLMGFSQRKLGKLVFSFSQLSTGFWCLMGLLGGTGLLVILKIFAPTIMPDVFVERSLPVDFDSSHFLVALFVPYGISTIFSVLAFRSFFSESRGYSELIRKLSD